MGLPDFHRIQQGFSAYKFFNTRTKYSGITTYDYISEAFRGEVISGLLTYECIDKRIQIGEIISLILDGNTIAQLSIRELLSQSTFNSEAAIVAVRYDYQLRLHLYLRPGLAFNTGIQITQTIGTLGEFYLSRNILFGVY